MNLSEFLNNNDRIDRIEIISFQNTPPHYVALIGICDRTIYVASDMYSLSDREEIGVLRFVTDYKKPKLATVESFEGGCVSSLDYMMPPVSKSISGVRMKLDNGQLVITSGDLPCSLFVQYNGVKRGRSEFPINDYLHLAAVNV